MAAPSGANSAMASRCPSATRISDGRMRAISLASCAAGAFAARNWPLVSVIQTRPASPLLSLDGVIAKSVESFFSVSSAPSVMVPGVTMRTILRSMTPLAWLGSPICSLMATDWPSLTSRARYCSSVTAGTPHIGMGLPFRYPRLVSVRPRSWLILIASSKNVS